MVLLDCELVESATETLVLAKKINRDAEVSIALGSEHRPKAVFLARQGFSGCFEKKILNARADSALNETE